MAFLGICALAGVLFAMFYAMRNPEANALNSMARLCLRVFLFCIALLGLLYLLPVLWAVFF